MHYDDVLVPSGNHQFESTRVEAESPHFVISRTSGKHQSPFSLIQVPSIDDASRFARCTNDIKAHRYCIALSVVVLKLNYYVSIVYGEYLGE
jgi:hypothetical protein